MNFWISLSGTLEAELTSADPEETLRSINARGIRLYQVECFDDLTVQFRFFRRDHRAIAAICKKRGDLLKIRSREGLFWRLQGLLRRPFLLGGVLLGLALTLWLPTRVLFFQIEGNDTVPARKVLEAAEECGIRFGASRREVRSEKMKNLLLGALPELKWAGINTAGCTAVLSVREREPETMRQEGLTFSNVVAAQDGYITSCTVTRGSSLCAPGQVVQKGQLLISGFTDCGICIRAEAAEGEIYAQTRREIQAVTPIVREIRTESGETKRRYSLILGKKRINLWKDSGIWDATCGRMYEEYYITLPGGFQLPIAIAVETVTAWNTAFGEVAPEDAEAGLSAFAEGVVQQQMTAGRILQKDLTMTKAEELYLLEGRFLCEEMIGRVITEEIGDTNGKTD